MYGPGTGLAHTLHLSFLGGTNKLLVALVENVHVSIALREIHSRALVDPGHDIFPVFNTMP